LPVTLLGPADYRTMPWRNGQGTTTEIATDPVADFRWRLSAAAIAQSGPFSNFAGYDRIIAVIDGDGLKLAVAPRTPVLLTQPAPPYRFSGDAATTATLLGGPVRALNLFYRRDAVAGSLAVLRAGGAVKLAGGTVLLHVARGEVSATHNAFGRRDLVAGQTLTLDGLGGELLVQSRSGGHALVASITPLDDA
jgi:environmental stress-induced protein Ves